MITNFPLLLEYGGERPTEVEAGSQDLISRSPQRDDPPRSKKSGNRLIVRKVGGLFELRAFKNGHDTGDLVKAVDAQMIIDYVRATWPVGTIVQWIIIPPVRPVVVAGRAEAGRSWLKRIPVGARL